MLEFTGIERGLRQAAQALAKRTKGGRKAGWMSEAAQTSGSVLMVRPASFGFHPEAAHSNSFASRSESPELASKALREFDTAAQALSNAGVEVLVLEDTPAPARPDAVFPNNWVSFHADGSMVLYPMETAGRRLERNVDGVRKLLLSAGYQITRTVDLSEMEQDGHFLEGTGSLILDRPAGRAFASLSPRTTREAIETFDLSLGYRTTIFDACDRSGQPIYHTNVLLSLGSSFAVLCPDVVPGERRETLRREVVDSGRTLIEVDYEQMRGFACNLLELRGGTGPVIALSSAARRSFRPDQLRLLERSGGLVEADIPTIEAVGGGSLRCMIADVHLPRS